VSTAPPVAGELEAEALASTLAALSIDGLRATRRHLDEALVAREAQGVPLRHHMMPDAWYADLDPGIRFAVRVLHAAGGIETSQSCEGGVGHAYPDPTIDLVDDEGAGLRAVAALTVYGLDVWTLSRVWPIRHGMPCDVLWRVTLRRAWPERADDRPNFVQSYVAQGAL